VPWNGDDVPRILCVVAQRLTEKEDLLGQVSFLDRDIRPDGVKQFVFRDDAVPVRDEEDQGVERFRHQRHRRAVADEETLVCEELESVELPVLTG
jgi:hypothetical protein